MLAVSTLVTLVLPEITGKAVFTGGSVTGQALVEAVSVVRVETLPAASRASTPKV